MTRTMNYIYHLYNSKRQVLVHSLVLHSYGNRRYINLIKTLMGPMMQQTHKHEVILLFRLEPIWRWLSMLNKL
jgi:hypothetical protein